MQIQSNNKSINIFNQDLLKILILNKIYYKIMGYVHLLLHIVLLVVYHSLILMLDFYINGILIGL
jgi:hypothetical protein